MLVEARRRVIAPIAAVRIFGATEAMALEGDVSNGGPTPGSDQSHTLRGLQQSPCRSDSAHQQSRRGSKRRSGLTENRLKSTNKQ